MLLRSAVTHQESFSESPITLSKASVISSVSGMSLPFELSPKRSAEKDQDSAMTALLMSAGTEYRESRRKFVKAGR